MGWGWESVDECCEVRWVVIMACMLGVVSVVAIDPSRRRFSTVSGEEGQHERQLR